MFAHYEPNCLVCTLTMNLFKLSSPNIQLLAVHHFDINYMPTLNFQDSAQSQHSV